MSLLRALILSPLTPLLCSRVKMTETVATFSGEYSEFAY